MHSAASGTSTRRESPIGFPMSSVSRTASSSACSSISSAKRKRTRLRRFGARRDQVPLSNATRAPRTARSTSAASHAATWASVSPVAGLMHSKVSPLSASTYAPSTNARSRMSTAVALTGRPSADAPSRLRSRRLGDLVEVRHRDAGERALVVRLVVPHAPERRRVAVDRGHGRAARVAHPVDVGGVEDERLAGAALAARVAEPLGGDREAILDERPLAHVHAAGGQVVVVVAGLLVVEPAEEPHIEMLVAVELRVVALARIVAHVAPPQARLVADARRELGELGLLEVAVGREVLPDPLADRHVLDHHVKSSLGLSRHNASSTACPKDWTGARLVEGSSTGPSLPKTSRPPPYVVSQSSSARRPY